LRRNRVAFEWLLGIAIGLIGGTIGGGIWAYPAGWIKSYRGGHEVITTIMLNSVAYLLAVGLVAGPLKAAGQQSPTTGHISTMLPTLAVGGASLSLGLLVACALPFLADVWKRRTVGGFQLEATGANATAALYAGIDARQVIVRAMAWSGAFAGFAGAIQVVAYQGRFFPDISSGTGFDALGVALLAGASPIGVIPAAIGFSVISQADPLLQIDGLPKGLTEVLLGCLIVIGAAIRFRKVKASVEL